jgi:hypothetical protein
MVIDNNVLNSLLQIIKHEKKVIRKEVYWVISNFTAGTVQQLEAVINSGILAHMIQTILAEDYEVIFYSSLFNRFKKREFGQLATQQLSAHGHNFYI